MAANPSHLFAVEYADESSFGEDAETWDFRLPVVGRVDTTGLKQPKVYMDIVKQRMNTGRQDIRGPMGGEVSMEFYLPGAGASCSGAVPTSNFATFLGRVVGTSAASASAGTTVSSGISATQSTVAASGTFNPGALCRVGALGDGRGEGQFYAISAHAGTTLSFLTAMSGTASANDVVYTGYMVHPYEDPGTAGDVTGIRLGLRSANQQYICHGCYPTSLRFSDLGPGKMPKVGVTFGVAWWETDNDTFPTTTSIATDPGVVVAAGSLFYNAVGTAVRATRTCRDFEINIDMETVPLMGPGGVDAYQSIVGARRTKHTATVSWVEDAEAAGTNTIESFWNTTEYSVTNKHALYSLCTRDGASAGFYFPNITSIGDRPIQTEMNGLNCVKWNWRAETGATTTDAIRMSSWRLCLA